MENYDVTVFGAGLAGLQAARLLGERGCRILFEGSPRFHCFLDPRRLSQLALSDADGVPPELNLWPAQRGEGFERETVA